MINIWSKYMKDLWITTYNCGTIVLDQCAYYHYYYYYYKRTCRPTSHYLLSFLMLNVKQGSCEYQEKSFLV